MKKTFQKILIVTFVFGFILVNLMSSFQNISYADNIKVLGDTTGLKVIPADKSIFNYKNLNPGDTHIEEVTLKNQYTNNLQMFLRTERVGDSPTKAEHDLFKQLLMTVYLDEVEIYSGDMKDFAPTNEDLGSFGSNGEKN